MASSKLDFQRFLPAPSCRSIVVIRLGSLFKSELRTLLLNSGNPQSSLDHFLNSGLQGSPKFTRAPKSTRAFIDSITVSDLSISQDTNGIITVEGGGGSETFCNKDNTTAGCDVSLDDNDARGFSTTVSIVGNDVTVTESTLEGGRTGALVMEIESASDPNIGADVNISDKLNLVLRFTSGQDELLTDVFTTRVKPG